MRSKIKKILREELSEPNLSSEHLDIIRNIVQELIDEGDCNFKGGASCGVASEEIAKQLGWDMRYGSIYNDDGELIDDDHAWVIKPDGTIIDPTISQFSDVLKDWPGYEDIAVIPKGHSFLEHYEDYGQA